MIQEEISERGNMTDNEYKLEYKIGEKSFFFTCDKDSPIGHVKDALFKLIQYVGQVEDKIVVQQKESAAQEDPKEG